MGKPNCHECEYQGKAIGSVHSTCKYPGTSTGMLDFFVPQNLALRQKLKIVGNPHGVRNGWFMWPVNFDPVWLENCDGFKSKNLKDLQEKGVC